MSVAAQSENIPPVNETTGASFDSTSFDGLGSNETGGAATILADKEADSGPGIVPQAKPKLFQRPLFSATVTTTMSTTPLTSTNTATATATENRGRVGTATTMDTSVTEADVTEAENDDPFAAWNRRDAVTRETAYPVRVRIPAIGIDAFVEELGERADGGMATPRDPAKIAWYREGAIPGENGNVVMAGHLDRIDGSPAVFWDLAALAVGDTVIVYDRAQTAYHYVVTMQQNYPYDQAPIDKIFGFGLISQLNLITCRGEWDGQKQTYSERLVVYTKLTKVVEGAS